MKSISELLVPLCTFNVTSATPVQAKSNLLTRGSFAEALAHIKDKVMLTRAEQRSPSGRNHLQSPGSLPFTSSNILPAHLPVTGLTNKALENEFNGRALDLRIYRQTLLTSNIANSDTPGYKTMDIENEVALRDGKTSNTVTRHYVTLCQGAIDGNTV